MEASGPRGLVIGAPACKSTEKKKQNRAFRKVLRKARVVGRWGRSLESCAYGVALPLHIGRPPSAEVWFSNQIPSQPNRGRNPTIFQRIS